MKVKALTLALCFGMVLAGCNNLQKGLGIGAAGGAVLGGVIGKIAGNTAVGAAVGAAVGQAADEAHRKDMEAYQERRMAHREADMPDRPYQSEVLEIRRPMLLDANRDEVLSRGEEARVVFEIFNTSTKPVYRILPSVAEITGNKHIVVSDNVMIESIAPGKGIRYTALVRADHRLKDGDAIFRIGVFQGHREIVSQTREFRIQTSKR